MLPTSHKLYPSTPIQQTRPLSPQLQHPHTTFSTLKVPLAQKHTVEQFRQRATIIHPHVPLLIIDSSSPFYLTVHIQTVQLLSTKELLTQPLSHRIHFLQNILKGVAQLSHRYGFFYLQEGMLGHRASHNCHEIGQVCVWISDDLQENSRKFPIERGRFSEETFVSSFKTTFMAHLSKQREFHSASSINCLLAILEQRQHIHQSLHFSPSSSKFLSTKGSLLGPNSLTVSDISVEQWREKTKAKEEKGKPLHFSRHIENKSSMLSSMARRGMSTSYLEQGLQFSKRRLKRSCTETGYLARVQHYPLPMTPQQDGEFEEGQDLRRKLVQSTSDQNFRVNYQPSVQSSFQGIKSFQLHAIPNTKQSIHLDEHDLYQNPQSQEDLSRSKSPASVYYSESPENIPDLSDMKDMEMELDCLFSKSDSEKQAYYDVQGLELQFECLLEN